MAGLGAEPWQVFKAVNPNGKVLLLPSNYPNVPHAPVLPLELLTERQREIVFLHYYADLDYAAIAEALAISPGTVGATLNAARQALRAALE